jgi:hypothetical protein
LKPSSFLSHIPEKLKNRPTVVETLMRKEVSPLEHIHLETTDIFRGAYFLSCGGELSGVRIRNNGKRIATFLITGKDLDRLDRDYRAGRALVNPLQFRESLNHLRDVMFKKLREYDPASHKRIVAVEGRMRHGDRKRANRGHQT